MYEKAEMTTAQEWIKKVSCWVDVCVWGGGGGGGGGGGAGLCLGINILFNSNVPRFYGHDHICILNKFNKLIHVCISNINPVIID